MIQAVAVTGFMFRLGWLGVLLCFFLGSSLIRNNKDLMPENSKMMNIQKSTSTFLVDAGLMNLMPICLLMPISMIFELELQSYFTMYQKRKSQAIGTPEEQDLDI
ncbi:hypothetical protein L2E82_20104 [Cichorium intybus]|uniref:Uncharacterized protein n=1 Tax=Cichorium intybus TaxID=13427 RepID=A0ACB9DSQ7_CICIN|nr:hypothetical protein L2E82_20104 [Cichorium intybus]